MAIKLIENDLHELRKNYPTLNCSFKSGVVWGTLHFDCSYSRETQELVYGNLFDNCVSDEYEIRIDFNEFDTFGFPKVYEDSGLIKKFANEKSVELKDLHMNENDHDSCCLGIFPEYEWTGVSAFIKEKVTPFFYWQSHRRVFGKEPWRGYLHDDAGILEAMTLSPAQSSKGRFRNVRCPCGSGGKYKKCCLLRDSNLKSKLKNNALLFAKL